MINTKNPTYKFFFSLTPKAITVLLVFIITGSAWGSPLKLHLPFPIYTDYGSYVDTYIPSGWMGDFMAIILEEDCETQPFKGKTCMKWTFDLFESRVHRWAGVYWQYPANNWGNIQGGFDLSQARTLSFYAKGEKGGEVIEFKMGGIGGLYSDSLEISSKPITLTTDWRQYIFKLEEHNTTYVNGGFCWVANADVQNGHQVVFYIDEIWVK